MALLDSIAPSGAALLQEIALFSSFLASNPRGERKHFLPFFKKHVQLGAFLGTLNDKVSSATHVKNEVPLWGDFVCDLVAGNIQDGAFVFVEFEDASKTSLFQPQRGRRNSRWGTRVEGGISQVTDWLFRIHTEQPSATIERDFGASNIACLGVVVVGRSHEVSPYDRRRLEWRSEHSIIGGSKLSILTYDDLLTWLTGRSEMLRSYKPNPVGPA
jgi:Domain of unknown function (DUF4263)